MENKFTIFGEEHFIDNTMIELIEAKNNAIDNMVFDEMEKSIKITLPYIKINAEKLRKWVDLCMQLENIEHSELINIATKKKILDLKSELEELKKNAIIRPAKYKAKLGTTYWFICDDGDILDIQADSPLITNIRWKFGNMFATYEEAEEALKKLEKE